MKNIRPFDIAAGQPDAPQKLDESSKHFQEISLDQSRTLNQRSDARLIVEFADWMLKGCDKASELVRCLQLQERIKGSIQCAEGLCHDEPKYQEHSFEFCAAEWQLNNALEELKKCRDDIGRAGSEYHGYCSQLSPALRTRYASAMDSLGVRSDDVIRQCFEKIVSADFQLPLLERTVSLKEPPASLKEKAPTESTCVLPEAKIRRKDMDFSTAKGRTAAVNLFIKEFGIDPETGRKLSRAKIWKSAGYLSKKDFGDWQSMKVIRGAAAENIESVLLKQRSILTRAEIEEQRSLRSKKHRRP